MSGGKHPFDQDKTVIKSGSDRPPTPSPAADSPGRQSQPRDATILAPSAIPGKSAGTSSAADPLGPAPASPERLPLEAALGIAGKIAPPSGGNPLIAAATPSLVLLGRLRLHRTEIRAAALAAHFAELIVAFSGESEAGDVPGTVVQVAQYALCATVDDVVANLPEVDPQAWAPISMLRHFFKVPSAATGFFEELDKALARPDKRRHLLEFMTLCLDLGFEGQYRTRPDGAERLREVRHQAFQALRAQGSDAGKQSLSLHGQGVPMRRKRLWLPLLTLFGFAALALLGAFLYLRQTLGDETQQAVAGLIALNPTAPLAIDRPAFQPYVAPPPPKAEAPRQLDRLRDALGDQLLADGAVSVMESGQTIVIRIANEVLFAPGGADLLPEFETRVVQIAKALDAEPGSLTVVGHTDALQPRPSSVFKSNQDLSVARAQAVATALARMLGDPSRVTFAGKGDLEPIGDDATPEGRALNRRVEIIIPQEDTSH